MSTPDDETAWRRLHPLSLLFRLAAVARRLLLPLVALLFVSRGRGPELWFAVLFVPSSVAAIVGYLSYRYRLGPEELMIRQGILTRNERHVPYARVQNIDLVQSLLQRWLGVAEARFETAGGTEPEAVMRVLSLSEVALVRERVFRDARPATGPAVAEGSAPAPAAEPLYRARLGDLAILGLTSNRGLAVVAAAFGALWQLEPLGYDPETIIRRIADVDPASAHLPLSPSVTAVVLILGFAAVVAALKLLSVAWTIVRLHGFVLEAKGADLSARYGLLTKIAATVPRQRIQRVAIRRGPLERWLGRAAVQIETAGRGAGQGGGEDGGSAEVERLWLAPSIAEREIAPLLSRVLPGVALEEAEWQPLAARAGRRILGRGLVLTVPFGAGLLLALGAQALAALVPIVGLVVLHAWRWPRHTAYALLAEAAVWRSGWWTRRTSVVPYEKIQVVALSESPFDRRHEMASLALDTAGAGRVGHAFVVPYLDRARADALAGRLAEEAGARAFRW
jgi:putative membrane protein